MAKALRVFAVLLLALSIPLQGMAAVAAGQCMAFGHHQDGGAQEHHGHAQDGADGHQHSQDDLDGDNSHCGPCAACCASASITGPTAVSILSFPSDATYGFSPFPPPSVQPDSLDRPPLAL